MDTHASERQLFRPLLAFFKALYPRVGNLYCFVKIDNENYGTGCQRGLPAVYLNGWPKRPRCAISESGFRFFVPLPTALGGYPKGMIASTSRSFGMPRSGFKSSRPMNPTQFDPIPSDHAAKIID